MNYAQQIIILAVASLTLTQVAQASCDPNHVVAATKIDLSEVRKVAATKQEPVTKDPLIENDPRIPVNFQDEMKDTPQIASVARVALNADGSTLTGSLVTKCHVLINLHLLDDEGKSVASSKPDSAPLGLLKLSDSELAHNSMAKLTLGFLPNEKADFESGYGIKVTGHIVKTGRKNFGSFDYTKNLPAKEDWAIVRVDNPEYLAHFAPLDIASEQEIEASNKTGFMVGYPSQLLTKSQKAYMQQCKIQITAGGMFHTCVSTAGNSSSPFLFNFGNSGKSDLKIAGIGLKGKYVNNTLDTTGVPAYSFRDTIETLKKTDPCN